LCTKTSGEKIDSRGSKTITGRKRKERKEKKEKKKMKEKK
jgi:hypothetical protein